ncbi:MAG TPA: hypothetical protein VMT71_18385 [Syntrophorhabdales bacterium]|nr:hypothetical protein [Syntrophorhabdales bacterium]
MTSAPVIIGFALENLSSGDVWVLKWYTPLEGIKGRIFEVSCDGVEIPYEGMLMKRGDPEENDYIQLGSAESVRAEFDLTTAYSLPLCSECTVTFKGRIHDVVLNRQDVPRPWDEHQAIDAQGDPVVFSVVAV